MKIEEIKIDKIIPYENNNKMHDDAQVNKIANSIKEFWFLQPLVIDKNDILIVWHWRLEWAKKLWLKTVPCLRAEHLTEEQIKKYRILDNKLNESDWNLANLKSEIETLPDFNYWDLTFSVYDVFPEFEIPEFDEDEFWDEKQSKEAPISLTVIVENEQQLTELKNSLQKLWYTNYR